MQIFISTNVHSKFGNIVKYVFIGFQYLLHLNRISGKQKDTKIYFFLGKTKVMKKCALSK